MWEEISAFLLIYPDRFPSMVAINTSNNSQTGRYVIERMLYHNTSRGWYKTWLNLNHGVHVCEVVTSTNLSHKSHDWKLIGNPLPHFHSLILSLANTLNLNPSINLPHKTQDRKLIGNPLPTFTPWYCLSQYFELEPIHKSTSQTCAGNWSVTPSTTPLIIIV